MHSPFNFFVVFVIFRMYNEDNESVIVDTFQGQFRNKVNKVNYYHYSYMHIYNLCHTIQKQIAANFDVPF
jgi:hypothetical protein